jgi:hypothetical protein
MQEIKPTWKIAYTVIRRHALISALLLLGCFLVGTVVVSLALILQGEEVSFTILHQIYGKYKGFISWLLFALYAYPVSLYAAIRTWQYKYKDFRFVIYQTAQPESRDGIDKVAS